MANARMPDEFFDELSPFLPVEKSAGRRGGRPAIPHRIVVKAIWFVLVTGCRWEDVPLELGCSGRTAHRRLQRWYARGIWERLHLHYLTILRKAGVTAGRKVQRGAGWPGRSKNAAHNCAAVSARRIAAKPRFPHTEREARGVYADMEKWSPPRNTMLHMTKQIAIYAGLLSLSGGCDYLHHMPMKSKVSNAIHEAGGIGALKNEVDALLRIYAANPDAGDPLVSNVNTTFPTIRKLTTLLSPNGHDPWIAPAHDAIPAHVVIRFGSHRRYEYVWLFDSSNVLPNELMGAECLADAVYLSTQNR